MCASQTRAVLSRLAVTMRFPSGENSEWKTELVCPIRRNSIRPAESMTVSPANIRLPSGENTGGSPSRARNDSICPLAAEMTRDLPELHPLTSIRVSSGEKEL